MRDWRVLRKQRRRSKTSDESRQIGRAMRQHDINHKLIAEVPGACYYVINLRRFQ